MGFNKQYFVKKSINDIFYYRGAAQSNHHKLRNPHRMYTDPNASFFNTYLLKCQMGPWVRYHIEEHRYKNIAIS